MIYLCSVYSLEADGDMDVLDARTKVAQEFTGEMLREGYCIFSPIAHCHEVSKITKLPKEWDFWGHLDMQYIDASDEVWVLKMPGWKRSVGITAEIKYAREKGKPIKYIPTGGFRPNHIICTGIDREVAA